MSDASRRAKLARFSALAGMIALVLVGVGGVACEHSDAVLNAKFGAGVTAPRYLTGMSPTEALPLRPNETTLGPGTGAEPVVDETDRMSCGDTPVGDLYVTDPAIYGKAQRLLFQMTMDQKVMQLTGLATPSYEDSNRFEDIQQSRNIPELNLAG